ncbi:MAG: DUF3570 domain-containing protein [Paraglaciecola sp.]|nr:DUF3570 domain-containing protein [Paraglaciecola sp.]NCT49545.1 DUF3570 domain-containing protein [Paraglaciecola sp.]
MIKNNNVLALLGAAATNLISVQANALDVAEDFRFGLRYHSYTEDSLPQSLGGSTDRYDIKVNQFSIVTPLSDSFDLSINYQQERMSGASPWYTLQDADGLPLQIMSGASIYDERKDSSVKFRYVDGANSLAVIAARSSEDDYKSASYGLEFVHETPDKQATWTVAADFSNDKINPVDADIFLTRPTTEQSKHSSSLVISYSQLLNKHTLLQLGASLSDKSGYLSDPYKMVLVNFELIGDNRPTTRRAKTLSSRIRYFVDTLNAALHVDYRYYTDSWDIQSHTFNVSWYQNLPFDLQLIPSVRFYNQSQSYFYDVFYQQSRSDSFYSTDYRLAEYGAITTGIKLVKTFDSWSITLSADQYSSGGGKGLANAEFENPALLDFKLISLGFDVRF